ncbi:hypothetical protein SLEP1_g32419 [Rubroshorea leprosula]|uniref:Uncharacterized protein n=1 Tax=Rubroshorea leprosula TaxID=152421 RepID=A0AAV5KD83_9ROSI|nr:hypothetical protein SLEP1_g32419 [Rubroshorea leprosula]
MSSSFLPCLLSDYPAPSRKLLGKAPSRKLLGKTPTHGIEKKQKLELGERGFFCSEA